MSNSIETVTLQPQPTAIVRATVSHADLASTLGQALPTVWTYLVDHRGIHPASPPLVLYQEFSAEQITLEAGFALSEPITISDSEQVKASELPGGSEVAHTWHIGPYDTLEQTHSAVHTWAQEQGKELAGPPWEVYWTDPAEHPDPSTWRTEIFQPLK